MTQDRTPTLTRAQLAEAVHEATGLPKSDGAAMVASFLDIASETLCRGEPLLLSGFGKFIVVTRAARKGRNVKLGLDIDIAPRRAIAFRPAPGLLKRLNTRPPHGGEAWEHQDTGDAVAADVPGKSLPQHD